MITIRGEREVSRFLDNVDKAIRKDAVIAITDDVFQNVLKGAYSHRDTGVMESNIRQKVQGEAGLVWIDDKNMLVDWKGKKINYASFVLFGTKPHKIEAKNKKSLRFVSGGLLRFVKSVKHPGYKGDNFLDKGAKKTFDNLENIYKEVLDGI